MKGLVHICPTCKAETVIDNNDDNEGKLARWDDAYQPPCQCKDCQIARLQTRIARLGELLDEMLFK